MGDGRAAGQGGGCGDTEKESSLGLEILQDVMMDKLPGNAAMKEEVLKGLPKRESTLWPRASRVAVCL